MKSKTKLKIISLAAVFGMLLQMVSPMVAFSVKASPPPASPYVGSPTFSIDFAAARPDTYNHATGGGHYNDGSNTYVVESLNGGDFHENDIVSFFDYVEASGDYTGTASIKIKNKFGNQSTNNHALGFDTLVQVIVNNPDTGLVDTGVVAGIANATSGIVGDDLEVEFDVTGLENGDKIPVRIDVKLYNNEPDASTSTVQSSLDNASLNDCTSGCNINTGNQTIPLQNAEDVAVSSTVTIVKAIVPGDADHDPFGFDGDLGQFSLNSNGAQKVFDNLDSGTYDITENTMEGWTLTNLVCNDPDQGTTVDKASRLAVIDLDEGENIICTFTNTKDDEPTADLTVIKNLDTDGDGKVDETNVDTWTWDLDEGNQNYTTGTTQNVALGTHEISEDMQNGWEVVNLTCHEPNSQENIDLGAVASAEVEVGETGLVCEFTNKVVIQECREGPTWADGVYSSNQGSAYPSGSVAAERSNPTNALGAPDGKFFSLGVDGELVVSFNYPVLNVDGADLSFHEVTNGRPTYPEEKATVYVSQDGSTWMEVGTVTNHDNGTGVGLLDFNSTGYAWVKYVKIVDATNYALHGNGADGYDLDAVDATYGLCDEYEEPVSDVTVCKYYDQNGNKSWDQGEPGLEGWKVGIENNQVKNSALRGTTGTDGCTVFEDMPFGSYTVREESRTGWIHTTPDVYSGVVVGENGARVEFGNQVYQPKMGSIAGFKYEDKNGNGKFDDGEKKLPGWDITAMAKGEVISDYLYVYPNGSNYPSNKPLLNGVNYKVHVYGNYTYWPASMPGAGIADGSYSLRPEGSYNPGPGAQWIVGDNLTGYEGYLELQVNNTNVNWGAFNSNHEYTYDVVGDGNPLSFRILDSYYGDNSGYLKVVITAENWSMTTTTDENGNYMFKDVPMGQYDVTETLKDGWMQYEKPGVINVGEGQNVSEVKFGNFELGEINGVKFNDLNKNGQRDRGEVGLEDWTIYLMKGDEKVAETKTLSDGSYAFTNLPAGRYMVCEVMQDGWVITTTGDENDLCEGPFGVNSGAKYNNVMFGNYMYGHIEVFKFEDINGNGLHDDNEPGIGDWPIYVDRGGGPALLQTDDAGYLNLNNLNPGTYKIWEGSVDGWQQTSPDNYFEIQVQSGTDETVMFGNFKLRVVKAGKYEDMNGNGQYDQNVDHPLEGWKMYLKLPNGQTQMVSTGSDGWADFGAFPQGHYEMWEENRPGWTQTQPDNSKYVFDINESGELQFIGRFGNFKNGSIYGHKFVDNNANGKYENGIDQGKQNWKVFLYKWENNHWVYKAYDMTDHHGYYDFTNLGPGKYKVEEYQSGSWMATSQTYFDNIEKVSGQNQGAYDFFNFELGKVSGYKYIDNNADGQWQWWHGELPYWGWKIYLYGPIDNPNVTPTLRSEYTNIIGRYEFSGLPYGTYIIGEESKTGWSQTRPYVLTGNQGYSLSVGSSGAYVTKSLGGYDLLFGNMINGEVSGKKYEDMNGNGKYDNGDKPLENWTIMLCSQENLSDSLVSDVKVENLPSQLRPILQDPCRYATTDSEGRYKFENIPYGVYSLTEQQQKGWTQTGAPEEKVVVHSSHMELRHQNFFNFHNINVRVYKFEDKNHDGYYNNGDHYLKNWKVTLTGPEGVMDKYTNNSGYADFNNLGPGNYMVTEDEDGYFGDWVQTAPVMNNGNTYFSWEAVSGINKTGEDSLMFGNWHKPDITVVKYEDTNANGRQDWFEKGIKGWDITLCPVETDVAVPFKPAIDEDNLCITKTTDKWGKVEFKNVEFGNYQLSEESRENWMQTQPGGDGFYKVEVSESGRDMFYRFGNYEYGKVAGYKWEDTNQNGYWDEGEAGLQDWTIILCRLEHVDNNENGDDRQLEVLSVEEMKNNHDFSHSCAETWKIQTDEDGYYEFTGLMPGFYSVGEENKDNWVHTYPKLVHEFEEYSVGYGVFVKSGTTFGDMEKCEMKPQEREPRLDQIDPAHFNNDVHRYCPNFGNFEYGSIQGRKYNDVNRNGNFDQEEKDAEGNPNRLDDWTISLYKWNSDGESWDMVDSMLTGDDETPAGNVGKGQYRFVGLDAGEYLVCEEDRDNWVQTEPGENGFVNPDEENSTLCYKVEITSGTEKEGVQFGNYELIPDLYVTVTDGVDSPDFLNPGDTIFYTIEYGNIGEYGVDNAVVTKIVPNDTVFDATNSDPGWVCSPNGNAGSSCVMEVGSLAVGETGTLTFAVTISPVLTVETTIYDPVTIYYYVDDVQGYEITLANNVDTDDLLVKIPSSAGVDDENKGTTGEVLGASDELATTGSNMLLILMLFVVFGVLSGTSAVVVAKKKLYKSEK